VNQLDRLDTFTMINDFDIPELLRVIGEIGEA